MEFSDYYNQNKEFIKTNQYIYVRITIVDAHTKRIVNEQLKPENKLNNRGIKDFFEELFQEKELNTIITDDYSAYPDIIAKMGANHKIMYFI